MRELNFTSDSFRRLCMQVVRKVIVERIVEQVCSVFAHPFSGLSQL
jgi:hypothetical protein